MDESNTNSLRKVLDVFVTSLKNTMGEIMSGEIGDENLNKMTVKVLDPSEAFVVDLNKTYIDELDEYIVFFNQENNPEKNKELSAKGSYKILIVDTPVRGVTEGAPIKNIDDAIIQLKKDCQLYFSQHVRMNEKKIGDDTLFSGYTHAPHIITQLSLQDKVVTAIKEMGYNVSTKR